ncbi:MAG: DUF2339 domain-containing protein [Luteimonas sp.]
MEALILLLGLALLAVPVLLVVALVMIGDLRRRVRELEDRTQRRPQEAQPRQAGPSVPHSVAPEPARPEASMPPAPAPSPASAPRPRSEATLPPRPPVAETPVRTVPLSQQLETATRRANEDGAGARLLRWFTTGNVIAKVGMLVLLAGVAALLKYASDQGWLAVPIGWRLAGVAAAALVGLGFGWRQREARPAFALTLQGGAIGVLLLVVFAAFQRYDLMPAAPAFALSVALVAALCVLAVLQQSRTMAIFGILAGFMAPIWLSSGAGNHVVLFSYYALLNLGVLAMAWRRPWRELNLLGFAFTWCIGVAWGVLGYVPADYATAQAFLLLFFAFYLAIPLLYMRLRPGHGYDRIDGALVFGTPLVAFPLQALLLDGERLQLALCALALAGLYALLAWLLLSRPRWRAMGVAKATLAVGFATLAVPLAFSARVTACLFALEGAALIWLGLQQGRRLPRVTGVALQLVAALAYALSLAWNGFDDGRMFANPGYLAALLIAVAGLASAWAFWRGERPGAALLAFLWGTAWWFLAGMAEIDRHVPAAWVLHAQMALMVVTGWLAAEARRWVPASALTATVAAMFALVLMTVATMAGGAMHPLAAGAWWAWAVFLLAGGRALWCLRVDGGSGARLAQGLWWLAWPLAVSISAWHLAGQASLAPGWRWAAAALPWLLSAAVSTLRWRWLRLAQGQGFDAARPALQAALFAGLGACWLYGLLQAGGAAPLPWLPLLNPLEAVQALAWALFARWLLSARAPLPAGLNARLLAGTLLFVLLSSVVLRAVHHWTGVEWSGALWRDGVAQTGITVLWSLLGMAAWIAGSRRGERGTWLAGAALMGMVLAKLVLVDWQHLGNLPGILSFIAYGLLCLAVGYFAPAPPRRDGPAGG